MEVHRSLVHRRVRAVALDEPEQGPRLALDHGERLHVARAQRDAGGRVVAPLPDEAGRRALELGQLRRAAERLGAERFGVRVVQRRLEGGSEHVRVEDPRVRVVEDRRLDASRQERVRLAREELVERVLAGDQHREARCATSGPPPLLPQRRDRPGKADRDRAVEEADVDAELERVGGRDAEELPLHQAPLDVPPLLGCVAGAIRRKPLRGRDVDSLDGEPVDEFRRLAALREADRPETARRELREEPRGLAQRARPLAELRVEERRVPDDDLPLGLRGRVPLDDGRPLSGERLREVARVRDRGRGEQELRARVVHAGEPAQAPQHVGDVRAEDATVDVRLVDDDEAQVVQDVAPAVVVREHADVEHVRVREDEVRPLAYLPARLGRRVAVVDGRPEPLQPELRERAGLVLGEGLRRVQIQGPRLRIARDRVEHGEVEGQRLPRRRARRDDDVLAAPGGLPGLRLVPVERRDADAQERGGDAWIEVVRERLDAGGTRRLEHGVRDLLLVQEVGPGGHGAGVGLKPAQVSTIARMSPSSTSAYAVCSFSCQPFAGSLPRKR